MSQGKQELFTALSMLWSKENAGIQSGPQMMSQYHLSWEIHLGKTGLLHYPSITLTNNWIEIS